MLIAFLVLNAALMLAGPVAVAGWWRSRTGVSWGLFGVGAGVFLLSQVVHLPLNFLVAKLGPPLPPGMGWVVPIALGLSAGLCEELSRYAGLRWWVPEVVSSRQAAMVALGHGGIESMILGGLGVYGLLATIAAMHSASLSPEIAGKIAELDATPWLVLVGSLERVFALTCHVAFGMLALRAVVSGPGWLLAAILGHAALDATAVALAPQGILAPEAAVAGMALLAVAVIWGTWLEAPTAAVDGPVTPRPISRQALKVDAATHDSRFDS
jgi:uncharacterized membrane protein YhfC